MYYEKNDQVQEKSCLKQDSCRLTNLKMGKLLPLCNFHDLLGNAATNRPFAQLSANTLYPFVYSLSVYVLSTNQYVCLLHKNMKIKLLVIPTPLA